MLVAALLLVLIAAALGTALAVQFLRPTSAASAPWPLAACHGVFGIGGLAFLVIALLRGPPRGLDQGTATFGTISAVLMGLAAAAGFVVLSRHVMTGRRAGGLIGIHATLAVGGVVILAAYLLA
jgi:hypothetical protein